MMLTLTFVCLVLLFAQGICEEGGLLDDQPYPPEARTRRARELNKAGGPFGRTD